LHKYWLLKFLATLGVSTQRYWTKKCLVAIRHFLVGILGAEMPGSHQAVLHMDFYQKALGGHQMFLRKDIQHENA